MDIEQYDVIVSLECKLEALLAVIGAIGAVACGLQYEAIGFLKVFVVFDDE